MLRRNSFVRIGPSINRHRIVPFQRPSTTDSMASIGHGDISFLKRASAFLLSLNLPLRRADKLVSGSI
jgi:hypothetical protein